MIDLDLTEAIAQVALRFESEGEAWSDDQSGDRLARYAVETAAPVIERQVRERIAADIEALGTYVAQLHTSPKEAKEQMRESAARIARGGGLHDKPGSKS